MTEEPSADALRYFLAAVCATESTSGGVATDAWISLAQQGLPTPAHEELARRIGFVEPPPRRPGCGTRVAPDGYWNVHVQPVRDGYAVAVRQDRGGFPTDQFVRPAGRVWGRPVSEFPIGRSHFHDPDRGAGVDAEPWISLTLSQRCAVLEQLRGVDEAVAGVLYRWRMSGGPYDTGDMTPTARSRLLAVARAFPADDATLRVALEYERLPAQVQARLRNESDPG